MIYTVTFNPALDYVVTVDYFTPGRVNRTVQENIYYGGKGINVSTVLANLGHESIALGFIAGFTGEKIRHGVESLGFISDFISIEKGMNRINVKIKSAEESEINGMGPDITKPDVEKLFEKLEQLKAGDLLILSGSIPISLDDDIYEQIMKHLEKKEILIIVDAEKDLLLHVLPYHPFLIKPNNYELGELFGVDLNTESDIVIHAKKLQEQGARNVLISRAGDGAILVDECGHIHMTGAPKGTVKNSVGAGDSMVAGFLAGYLEMNDYNYALQLGIASGSATAFSEGLATKEKIMELYQILERG